MWFDYATFFLIHCHCATEIEMIVIDKTSGILDSFCRKIQTLFFQYGDKFTS